ncbi:MAG: glycosyltransferase [Actinobacteria bacterium]|nr:glycosyltransferase [Actinomycetota bacterium]
MANNRSILMLTAEAGGGHKSVGLALKERFEGALLGFDLTVVNAFEELLDFPLSLINNAHRQIVRRSPALWNLLFESTSSGNRFSTIEGLTRLWTKDRVEELFDELNPSAVLSVIPLVNELIGEVAWDRGVPFAVVVTDMARVHPAWLSRRASIYCAPTEFVRNELVGLGIPGEKVFVTGLPTRRSFFIPPDDLVGLRGKLGIGRESFTVLMMGGGEGVGLSKQAVKELADLPGLELYIFTGRNSKLKKKIERRFEESAKVLGFVENVDEWLKAADLLITKSGPSTLVEAAASQTPTLFIGALPGQEQSIIDHLLWRAPGGNGNGLLCDASDISRRVSELMSSSAKRQELVDSIAGFANPSASAEVCSLIKDLIIEEKDEIRVYV